MTARYALYYCPPETSPLYRFARAWLGRDPATGEAVARPPLPGIDADRQIALTASPRHYGFHGTLKPPFALAEGKTAAQLRDAIAGFAATRSAFTAPAPVLRPLGRFLALVPGAPHQPLLDFAADTVRAFDGFRRPAPPEELAKRRQSGLTPRQDALLLEWGYPYVMEEFRFHLTLTERLSEEDLPVFIRALEPLVAGFTATALAIDSLCLFGQADREADFRLLERFALR